jgi:cell division protein FtsI/penicillin-binding protein 2
LQPQENAGKTVRTAWLLPNEAWLAPGAEDSPPRLRDDVWQRLAPLWQGVSAPRNETVAARLRVPFVFLSRHLPVELGDAVQRRLEADKIDGVEVHHEYGREYPQGRVARLLIGAADVDNRGTCGLEALYNQPLTGVDGRHKVTVDARGHAIAQEREEREDPIDGRNLELTLDATIQSYAEEAAAEAVAEFDADWGTAVVVDPYNGEVVALADAANAKYGMQEMVRSLALAYEPGSVMKPLVVAAALNEGLVTPNTQFMCHGSTVIDGHTLHDTEDHGLETVATAVRDSCNMTLIQIAQRLGQARLEPYLKAYGLLGRTGLTTENQEAKGDIFCADPTHWGNLKLATVSYGKGIQCSAVGIARAYSALVNGGTLPTLHLVRRVLDQDGRVVVEQPSEGGPPVISENTAAQVRAMMRLVVHDEEGTAHNVESKLYDFAGKTGTSVAYGVGTNRVVSFIGFGPYEKPRLLVLLSVCEPRLGHRWGATTCGPAWKRLMERILQYLGVPAKPGADVQPPAAKAAPAAKASPAPKPAPAPKVSPARAAAARAAAAEAAAAEHGGKPGKPVWSAKLAAPAHGMKTKPHHVKEPAP